MLTDKKVLWVLEYLLGAVLVVIPLADLAWRRSAWMDRIWPVHLFVVCLGVVLISCASSMRQRLILARRIDTLENQRTDDTGAGAAR